MTLCASRRREPAKSLMVSRALTICSLDRSHQLGSSNGAPLKSAMLVPRLGFSNAKVLRGRPSQHHITRMTFDQGGDAASQDVSPNGATWNRWTMTAYQIRPVQ